MGQTANTLNGRAMGCFVDGQHVLTANHFVAPQIAAGRTIGVSRWDGLYDATPAWTDRARDLALLRIGDRASEADHPCASPNWFPEAIGTEFFEWGMSVGYLAHIRREQFTYTGFFSAEVSFLHRHNSPWEGVWGLNRGLIEDGFSGSPAFSPSGVLMGVIVGSVGMIPQSKLLADRPFELPAVAPLQPVAQEIQAAMA